MRKITTLLFVFLFTISSCKDANKKEELAENNIEPVIEKVKQGKLIKINNK